MMYGIKKKNSKLSLVGYSDVDWEVNVNKNKKHH
jgi:hypothetical protein